jgi:hypothetical protein
VPDPALVVAAAMVWTSGLICGGALAWMILHWNIR